MIYNTGFWLVPALAGKVAGLEGLIRQAEKLGIRFGIWVEPEMVNPCSELYLSLIHI